MTQPVDDSADELLIATAMTQQCSRTSWNSLEHEGNDSTELILIYPERLLISPEKILIQPKRVLIKPGKFLILPERLLISPKRVLI